jgi:SPP1 family predicted phage head-tail adaptor
MREIGKLREYIAVENPTETPDSVGGYTVTWSTFANVWAKIEPTNSQHQYHSENLEYRVTHKITIRELAGLNIKMRISFENRIFHIRGFRDILERDRFQELLCEEGSGVAS